jgi:hypothetical protein
MFTIRFNLSKGTRYMKWKITTPKGNSVYVDPKEFGLLLKKCKLKNRRITAEKIFNGANKTVCSWIECKHVELITNQNEKELPITFGEEIKYNPRVSPFWRDEEGNDIDNTVFMSLVTRDNRVFGNINKKSWKWEK